MSWTIQKKEVQKTNELGAGTQWSWNTNARNFVKSFTTTFNKIIPTAGVYGKLTLVYSSDNWDHYIIAAKADEGRTLKPHVGNLLLRIRTYNLDNNQCALEVERKFLKAGLSYSYNYVRTDRCLMAAGNKVYKRYLINQGDNFLFAFVSVMYSKAAEGDVTLNPFEYLVQNCNGWKGKGTDETGNILEKIVLKQGEKQLNKIFPNKEGSAGAAENSDGYFRNCRLAGVMNGGQRSYYDTTFHQYSYGYGTHWFSCAMVQADIASPAGRLSSGSTDFEFHFKTETKQNLPAKFIFILPRVVPLTPQTASNVVKVNSNSYI